MDTIKNIVFWIGLFIASCLGTILSQEAFAGEEKSKWANAKFDKRIAKINKRLPMRIDATTTLVSVQGTNNNRNYQNNYTVGSDTASYMRQYPQTVNNRMRTYLCANDDTELFNDLDIDKKLFVYRDLNQNLLLTVVVTENC